MLGDQCFGGGGARERLSSWGSSIMQTPTEILIRAAGALLSACEHRYLGSYCAATTGIQVKTRRGSSIYSSTFLVYNSQRGPDVKLSTPASSDHVDL